MGTDVFCEGLIPAHAWTAQSELKTVTAQSSLEIEQYSPHFAGRA